MQESAVTKAPPVGLAKALRIYDYFVLGFGSMIGVGWVILVGDWITMGNGPFGAALALAIGGPCLFLSRLLMLK